MEPNDRPVHTFDPLLRDLITWELVRAEAGGWSLTERAQSRLGELAAQAGPWPPDRTVYFDHRCSGCGARTLTRLTAGAYVCDACQGPPPASEARARETRRRRIVPHRDRRIA